MTCCTAARAMTSCSAARTPATRMSREEGLIYEPRIEKQFPWQPPAGSANGGEVGWLEPVRGGALPGLA